MKGVPGVRWLKRKKGEPHQESAGQAAADRALGRAEERLERTRDETREILATAEKLRRLGQTNDFAARLREAMGGRA